MTKNVFLAILIIFMVSTAWADTVCDFDYDGDVDGTDLALYAADFNASGLALFANAFGKQTGNSHPLINPESDLTYLGAFLLPDEESNGTSWSYGGQGMTYFDEGDPAGSDDYPGSLFSISHPYQNHVSEFSIPEPVISADRDINDLNRAVTIQPFVDVTAGRQTGGLTGTTLGDIQYYPRQGAQTSDKLYWVMYEYYLPEPGENGHGWCELDFSDLQSLGVWRLGDFPFSATSKYLFEIPKTWADIYAPGKYLAGGRHRHVNSGSWGPALYAFGPWNDGNPPADGSSVDAVELLKYESSHMLRNYSSTDDWVDGCWLNTGIKSAVIFTGIKAFRTRTSGLEYYGEPCVDGCGYKGYHAEPYYGAILFYDPYLLAKVSKGTILSHEVQPYAVFNIEDYMFKQGCRRSILGGAAFDRDRGLIYVMEKGVEGFYAKKPIIHVFQLSNQGQEPDLIPPSIPENIQVSGLTSEQVELSWNASSDNMHLVGYIVFRNGMPVATTRESLYIDDKINPGTTYGYTVLAWDSRDNRSAHSEALVITTPSGPDSRMPIITDIHFSGITENSTIISWNTDEPASTYIKYEITYSGNYTIIDDSTLTTVHQVSLGGLTGDRNYSCYIAATDASDNKKEYPGKGFRTSSSGMTGGFAPVLNPVGSKRIKTGVELRFEISADDLDYGDSLVFGATGLPADAVFDPGTGQFTWTPEIDDTGSYCVIFSVNDSNRSDSEQVTIFVLD